MSGVYWAFFPHSTQCLWENTPLLCSEILNRPTLIRQLNLASEVDKITPAVNKHTLYIVFSFCVSPRHLSAFFYPFVFALLQPVFLISEAVCQKHDQSPEPCFTAIIQRRGVSSLSNTFLLYYKWIKGTHTCGTGLLSSESNSRSIQGFLRSCDTKHQRWCQQIDSTPFRQVM